MVSRLLVGGLTGCLDRLSGAGHWNLPGSFMTLPYLGYECDGQGDPME